MVIQMARNGKYRKDFNVPRQSLETIDARGAPYMISTSGFFKLGK
jgi:hypothetical protein